MPCLLGDVLSSQQGKSNIPVFFEYVVLAAKTKAAAVFFFPRVFPRPSYPSSSVRTVQKNIKGLEGRKKSTEPVVGHVHNIRLLVGVDRDPYDGLIWLIIIPIYN